jgi:hypothetical protein
MAKDFEANWIVLPSFGIRHFLCHIIHHFSIHFDWSKAPMDLLTAVLPLIKQLSKQFITGWSFN